MANQKKQKKTKENTTNATIIDDDNSVKGNHHTSQRAKALEVIKQKKILHVPEMGSWIVEGSSGDKYTVSLFPKAKCQCVALNKCYHILAAEMSIGIEEREEKWVINLAQLRLNSRKRQNRLAGKKQPRPIDRKDAFQCEINAAPDSKKSELEENVDFATADQNITDIQIQNISEIANFNTSTPAPSKRANKLTLELFIPTSPKCKPFKLNGNRSRTDDCETEQSKSVKINGKTEDTTLLYCVNESNTSWHTDSTQTIIIDDVSDQNENDSKSSRDWLSINNFSLKISDKFDINYNKKLTDPVINYSQKVLSDQFPSFNGFQDCCYVPFQMEKNEWKYCL